MRRTFESELPQIAAFMGEQFFEKEELQQMFRGVDEGRARRTAENIVGCELGCFFRYGDVLVNGSVPASAAAGIPQRHLSLWKRLPYAPQGGRALRASSKPERGLLKANSKVIQEVHSGNWFRKYCRDPYCFMQFAVGKEMRGKGIAREMLEALFLHVRKRHRCMVLKTFTASNVPIYEHFGSQLMETSQARGGELTEYRMLKRLDCNEPAPQGRKRTL